MSQKDKYANLGEVSVKLTRCKNIGNEKRDHKVSFTAAAEHGISEKALKGRSIGAHTKLVTPVFFSGRGEIDS